MSVTTDSGTVPRNAPVLDIDLYAADVVEDPWPALKRIREAGPVVWNTQGGFWMSASDRACRQIFARPGDIGQDGMTTAFFGSESFICIDDKSPHNALRNVWVPGFSHASVLKLAAVARKVTHQLLDAVEPQLRAGERVDWVSKLCRQLPVYVVAHMLGVAEDMFPKVIAWSDLMADATTGGFPIDYDNDPAWLAGEAAKKNLADYIFDQIRYRRKSPGDDLISELVHSDVGKAKSDDAIMVNVRQLLFAGNETTAKWLGNILVTLGQRPDIRDIVTQDRSRVMAANEEILRWQGAIQGLPRGVKEGGANFDGIELPPGTNVLLLLAGANRDPERYANPDELDIFRAPKPHLAFGYGMHSCLGAVLARTEAFEVVSAVLDRFPNYELAGPITYGLFMLRGPDHVWVKLPTS